MKTAVSKLLFLYLVAGLLLSCNKSDNGEPKPDPGSEGKYILMTDVVKFQSPGYFTAFSGMPSGTISNITSKSLQIQSAFGFRTFGKWIFNRTSTAGDVGLQKYTVADDGSIGNAGFIAGATQYVVVNETLGYYLDETRGALKLQKFNPTGMQRTGEIDLSSLQKAGVEYQVIGKHTLAAKEGKLYAGITYGTKTALGYGDDLFDYVEFAVIDIATDKLEKTIKYDGLRSIGWGAGGNKMWTLGDDGALYFYAPALGTGFVNSSAIRIKKGETDFDRTWVLNVGELQAGSTIGTSLVKGGKMYIELPSEPLSPAFTNLANSIFDYYVVDMATKQKTRIEGMPQHDYAWANDHSIIEIDGKIYFWVRNPAEGVDGYYVLEGNKATRVFNVDHGGSIWGFARL